MTHVSRRVTNMVVLLLALIWVLPFWFVVVNAIKSTKDFFTGEFWKLPTEIGFIENFAYVWEEAGIGSGFINSLIYGSVGSFFAIFIAALAAFSLTTLEVRGRLFWFLIIYSGTVFPFQMYLIPLFKMYSGFQMYDTNWGLTIFYTAVSIPFCLFVLRNFFTTIPKEIVEAARLDGSTDFRIFLQIFLPMSRAPIAVLFLFQFTWIWNDLLFGLTLSKSESVRPIMSGVASLQGMYAGSNIPAILVAVLIASVPTLLLFSFLQKNFMQGMSLVGK
ncbi:carbohydrate ABC transporter permease [Bacillus sp. sid0103]|uniref:carbohydrate ABC transporter permease n=1 Tax=Bacillus sp. sid0103 TaxID=2856337 RepID=UPI001C440BC6|nr:carbohydrate ABC transporter permease [Bacillus sp. sid0103]MBV7504374.1 carbohydrate ABC transporter permease [Bacillus sp. sid0103]